MQTDITIITRTAITDTPTLPTVHMNGTSREALQAGYDNAADKLLAFTEAWGAVEFNARDYYTTGPDTYNTARDERMEINKAIGAASRYLEAIRIHLYD